MPMLSLPAVKGYWLGFLAIVAATGCGGGGDKKETVPPPPLELTGLYNGPWRKGGIDAAPTSVAIRKDRGAVITLASDAEDLPDSIDGFFTANAFSGDAHYPGHRIDKVTATVTEAAGVKTLTFTTGETIRLTPITWPQNVVVAFGPDANGDNQDAVTTLAPGRSFGVTLSSGATLDCAVDEDWTLHGTYTEAGHPTPISADLEGFFDSSKLVFGEWAAVGGEPATNCFITIRKRETTPTLAEHLVQNPPRFLEAERLGILLKGVYHTQRNRTTVRDTGAGIEVATCVDYRDYTPYKLAVGKPERIRLTVSGKTFRATITPTEAELVADGVNLTGFVTEEAVID